MKGFILILCLALTAANASNAGNGDRHLICKQIEDVFAPAETGSPEVSQTRRIAGNPGKRGQVGPRGLPGLPGMDGVQGPPGHVDYGQVRSMVRESVNSELDSFRQEQEEETLRAINELDSKFNSSLKFLEEKLRILLLRKEGSVMLVNSDDSLTYGRVEIYHEGEWGTICDDSWDLNDANVVCRMLGFENAVEAPVAARYGQGSGQIWLDDVGCSGDDTLLSSCINPGWGIQNCGHGEDASVVCKPTE